jgi:8-oxo-dGTP pyrophosphatase MutT (NUDIX family)
LLAAHTPVGSIEADWPAGRVRISTYLGQVDLPTEIPQRVRCLVTEGPTVLVTWDIHGSADCLPGGGAEPGESVCDTARREVWEETAWHIDPDTIRVLGWMHIESFAPPHPDHPFPHPDGFMVVVHARPSHADEDHESWMDIDGFIERSAFLPITELPASIRRSSIHVPFLDAVFGKTWRRE